MSSADTARPDTTDLPAKKESQPLPVLMGKSVCSFLGEAEDSALRLTCIQDKRNSCN
jgi:hypothetical protein